MMKLWGRTLRGILLCVAVTAGGPFSAAGEESAPHAPPAEVSSTETQELNASTSTTTTSTSGEIAPLDPWDFVDPVTSTTTTSTTVSTILDDGKFVGALPVPDRTVFDESLPDEFETVLKKRDRRRIDRLTKNVRSRAIRWNRQVKSRWRGDARGAPEFRFCSVNFNNYGEKKEVRRLMKAAGANRLPSRRKALSRALADTGCDLVAVQGLLGRNFAYAKLGLLEVVERVEKRTKRKYSAFVAQSVKELGFNGFIVANDRIEVINTATHSKMPLFRLPGEEDQEFGRALFEIHFRVRRIGEGEGELSRRFLAYSGHLQRGLSGNLSEKESLRWQMAEVIRDTVIARDAAETERDRFDPPAVMLGVDLVGKRDAGAHYVVDGRRSPNDIYRQKCTFEGDPPDEKEKGAEPKAKGEGHEKGKKEKPVSKVICKDAPSHRQVLFSVFEGPPPAPGYQQVEKKTEDGVTKIWKPVPPSPAEVAKHKEYRLSTAQIYLTPQTLPLSVRSAQLPLRRSVGMVPLRNGLNDSPLVWMDVNW